ncbi:MAG: chemotaxis protein CheW, partial [Planctomycetota bacterium]|nr:chemotaxis protein CheW [Planctomycetota bacterium]
SDDVLEPLSSARLLVTEHAAQRWVFPVDEVVGIHRIGLDQLTDVPSTVANSPGSFSRAVLAWQRGSVGVLDADRLFESLQGSIQ